MRPSEKKKKQVDFIGPQKKFFNKSKLFLAKQSLSTTTTYELLHKWNAKIATLDSNKQRSMFNESPY